MMEDRQLLYLSQDNVKAVGLGMADIIQVLEDAFREKEEGRAEIPPKIGVHPGRDSFANAMPAYIPKLHAMGCKWVSTFPENRRTGLPNITGLIILNDPETGMPICVMDGVWITAKRTGAATALAARYLARPDSETVGILGCGVQGRSNLEALSVLFPIKRVVAYDAKQENAQRYVDEARQRYTFDAVVAQEAREAVSGCDLIVTAGPILREPHAAIQRGWMDRGAFASLVDYDSYWHGQALQECDKFCTDDTAQFERYRSLGYFRHAPSVYADLGQLAAGKKAGRETPEERTMACNLGLALDDMATAIVIYQRAIERKIGAWLSL